MTTQQGTCTLCTHVNRDAFHTSFKRGCFFQKVVYDAWGDDPILIMHKKCTGCRSVDKEIVDCEFCKKIPDHLPINCSTCLQLAKELINKKNS